MTWVRGTSHKGCIHTWQYLAEFFLKWRTFQKKMCTENQNIYFVFNNFFPENRAVYEIMWKKYGTARQATDDNIKRRMRFACQITKEYKHTQIYNTYCFSTTTMITHTLLNVTLYARCFSCFRLITTTIQNVSIMGIISFLCLRRKAIREATKASASGFSSLLNRRHQMLTLHQ
jgi:hypothetical protein